MYTVSALLYFISSSHEVKLAQWLKSLSTFVGNTLTNLSENSVFFKYCVKTKV